MSSFVEAAFELDQQYAVRDHDDWFELDIRRSLQPLRMGLDAQMRECDRPPGPGTLQRYVVQTHVDAQNVRHEHILYFCDGQAARLEQVWQTLVTNPRANITDIGGWELLVADRSISLTPEGRLTIL